MGLELARAYVLVGADGSGLQSDLDSMKNSVDLSLRELAITSAGVLGPIAALGKNIISTGLRAAGSFEQTMTEMGTMLGSAQEAETLLKKLTTFAVETPFEMPGILQVTNGLVQFGERGDELMETLRILGDASGGTAEKFQILGLVFNQVRGVGKLLTQDFRQLSTRGIISLQDIAKYYKVSTEEAQKMLSTGKVSFEDFRGIMKSLTEEGGRFENMMKKQSTTLLGLESTLSDALNIAKRIIATPLVPFVKDVTAAFIVVAEGVESFVRQGGDGVSFALLGATAFAALGTAIAGGAAAASLLGISLASLLAGGGIAASVVALGAAVGYLSSYLLISKEASSQTKDEFDNLESSVGGLLEELKTAGKAALGFATGYLVAQGVIMAGTKILAAARLGYFAFQAAIKSTAAAQIFFQAILNPGSLIKVAAGIAGAMVAVSLFNTTLEAATSEAEKTTKKLSDQAKVAEDASEVMGGLEEAVGGVAKKMGEVAEASAEMTDSMKFGEQVMRLEEERRERAQRNRVKYLNELGGEELQLFHELRDIHESFLGDEETKMANMVKGRLSGITGALNQAVEQHRALMNVENPIQGVLEGFKQKGATDEQVNQLEWILEQNKYLEEQNRLREEGKRLAESLATPSEKFEKELDKLGVLFSQGFLNETDLQRATERIKEQFRGEQSALDRKNKDQQTFIENGRFGFEDFSNRIQDKLMEKFDQNDELKKQTDMMAEGLKKQDELIKTTQKLKVSGSAVLE